MLHEVLSTMERRLQCMVRVPLFLVVLSVETTTAQDDYQIDISLAVLPMVGEQVGELLRYRQRPSNYWCESVSFATEKLFELVTRADSSGIPAESTTISIELEGDDPAVYIGAQYWYSVDKGVIEWYGRLAANNTLTASFIVPVRGNILGVFGTSSGSYRVSSELHGKYYILCKVDRTYPDTKIG